MTNVPVGGSWRQIDFVSPTIGFMGANGATARTTDGGASWQLMSGVQDCPVIFGMDFLDAQTGLSGGEKIFNDPGPGIFKTTDSGSTWVRKFPQSANDVVWLDSNTAVATVSTSIYRSTDAGETGTPAPSQISTGLLDLTILANGLITGIRARAMYGAAGSYAPGYSTAAPNSTVSIYAAALRTAIPATTVPNSSLRLRLSGQDR